MITIKEVAKECGVSIATVSNIINNKGRVSEEKKKEILAKAKEMGYIPNVMAKNLKQKKTNTIGIITEDLTLFNNAEIVDGINERLEEEGYTFLLGNLRLFKKYGNTYFQNSNFIKLVEEEFLIMQSKQVDGIIYVAAHCRELAEMPHNYEIPVVVSYSLTKNQGLASVIYDDEQAAYMVCRELMELGHKKIGIIAGEEDNFHTINRKKGVQKAFAEYGIMHDTNLLCYGDWSREKGYEGCKKLISQGATAIFAMSDVMAAGVYDYAIENGLEIGKDIALVGFDNREFSRAFHPKLSTVAIPLHEIGRKAAELILDEVWQIESGNKRNNQVSLKQENIFKQDPVFKMQCEMIHRESIKNS